MFVTGPRGSRITAIEGTPIERMLAAVEPLVPRDNPTTVLAFRPAFLVCAQVLTGLGLAPNADRITFSAAANFAAELVAAAEHVWVVGEPSGGSPNQYGDQSEIRLPYSGIGLASATTWVEVVPDQDLAVVPDTAVPLPAADYFAGRDPALHRALAGL